MDCEDHWLTRNSKYQKISIPGSSPSHVLRSYRSMEPHVINSYLLVGVAILLMMAVLVTLLNLAQPPLRRLIKYYFPGEQDYEIIV
ncbi:hypothetical protein RB195_013652 [Necator americanus]|uniref:Uncharacterized protein n=1 Tax=Necator americanus TaxID=51031 RepID=A0ABR1DWI4_NECAM